jgi:hypothetical protein
MTNSLAEGLWPTDPDSTEIERLREERPFGVDEAQRCAHSDFELECHGGTEGHADRRDLLRHRVDELRAVTTADVEPSVCREPTALIDPLDLPGVVLGVLTDLSAGNPVESLDLDQD